jgi:hypothetical protein
LQVNIPKKTLGRTLKDNKSTAKKSLDDIDDEVSQKMLA